jgi:arylsulfatase A-like enzyme
MGYQSGSTRYWSKQCPNAHHSAKRDDDDGDTNYFIDLMYGDGSCYSGYDGSDLHKYSTYLYRDKAIKIINKHNYDDKSLFLHVSFQAVHDPFEDNGKYESGVPKTYVGSSMYKMILKHVVGRKRRQYAMSLYLMDEAIGKIAKAVDKVGQLDNTYFIFTSDNGGCYTAGGRNGPLRGNKGTLFEGGTKVDALVYSTKLSSKQKGKRYGGLMHVTDWFPTILDMASLSFTPDSSYPLDGLSHWDTWTDLSDSDDATVEGPRTSMIYNYYTDVSSVSFPTGQPVRRRATPALLAGPRAPHNGMGCVCGARLHRGHMGVA